MMRHSIDTIVGHEGYNPPATIGGVGCREILGNSSYVYCQASQGLVMATDPSVTIGITFLDSGTDRLQLQYNAIGNSYKGLNITKTNTGTWKRMALTITDAHFVHSMSYSADIRIDNAFDGSVEYISAVDITNNSY